MSTILKSGKIEKLHFMSMLCFVFTVTFNLSLPFTNAKINNIFLLAFAATTIILAVRSKNVRLFNVDLLLFISIYLAFIPGLITTENYKQAIADLTEQKVGLLALPILVYLSPRYSFHRLKYILLTFVISCLFTTVYCLTVAVYLYLLDGSYHFSYHDFSMLVNMHAIYLALFFSFAIIILIVLYETEGSTWSFKVKGLFGVSLFVLTIAIFLLAARLHQIIVLAGFTGYITYLLRRRTNTMTAVFAGLWLAVVIMGVILIFPQNRERFKQLINYGGQYGVYGTWGEQQMRPLMWSCALQLIAEEPLAGHGTGDVQDKLLDCYRTNGYNTLLHFPGVKFNAHNQFLEVTIGIGIWGLLIFAASLIVPFIKAAKNGNSLYVFFIILFTISCLSESFLERHNGVAFFGFFNALLFFNSATTGGKKLGEKV